MYYDIERNHRLLQLAPEPCYFCSSLHATKAFDRIKYCKLFKLLIKRQLPAHVIRLLINMFTNNPVSVTWGGVMSDYFLVVYDFKQGGVLSPLLFGLYIDDMLLALSQSRGGCYIGSIFVGALVYADDIVSCPSVPVTVST